MKLYGMAGVGGEFSKINTFLMQNSQLLKQCKQLEYLILCILKMQSWGWRAGSAANRALPKDQLIRSQESLQADHKHL